MIDRIVVATGTESAAAPLASGSVNVFQKIFFRRLSLQDESTDSVLLNETTPAPSLFNLVPDVAAETDAGAGTGARRAGALRSLSVDRLISRGATLFFEGTFGGNGRTCGTCHPASNNFTIDPAFIRDAARQRSALRGRVQSGTGSARAAATDAAVRPDPREPGWPRRSGRKVRDARRASDARPADDAGKGHEPREGAGSNDRLVGRRVAGHRVVARIRDWRRDAAFHQDDWRASPAATSRCRPSISSMRWKRSSCRSAALQISISPRSRSWTGTSRPDKSLFLNGTGSPSAGGTCGFCHVNGGAFSINGQNRNFNTNVEGVAHPARAIQDFPRDGGFGQTANTSGTLRQRHLQHCICCRSG